MLMFVGIFFLKSNHETREKMIINNRRSRSPQRGGGGYDRNDRGGDRYGGAPRYGAPTHLCCIHSVRVSPSAASGQPLARSAIRARLRVLLCLHAACFSLLACAACWLSHVT